MGEIKNLTIQECAEQFEEGDQVYLPEDIEHMEDEIDELDLAKSIWEALDYTRGLDGSKYSTFEPCRERAARKDWILRKNNK
jgi:hypothetical protein